MLHTYIRTFDVTSIVENFLTTKRSLKTCVQRPAQTYPITLPKEEMLTIQINRVSSIPVGYDTAYLSRCSLIHVGPYLYHY